MDTKLLKILICRVGLLSEELQEGNYKNIKRFRDRFTRKCSRYLNLIILESSFFAFARSNYILPLYDLSEIFYINKLNIVLDYCNIN